MRRLLSSPLLFALALAALAIGIGGNFKARPPLRRQARTFSPVADRIVREALAGVGSTGPGLKGGGNCSSASASCSVANLTSAGAASIAAGGSASFGTFITGPNGNTIGVGTGGRTGFVLNNSLNFSAGSIVFTGIVDSTTAPSISSGFGTSPSIVNSNGTASFQINVGTGGTATSGVIGLPTATNGWTCFCADITTPGANVTRMTANSTTSCTVTNVAMSTGAATAWTASDKLWCMARAN